MDQSNMPPGEKDPWVSNPKIQKQKGQNWEQKLIVELATSALKEQRRGRRWSIFFKVLFFAYITFIGFYLWQGFAPQMESGSARHTALIKIGGVISSSPGDASAQQVTQSLRDAYKSRGTAGIILEINSPGGSPVQAGQIYDEIKRLKALHPEIPVHAVIGDICASGGYYVAVASDNIYVDKASLVGSIGVRMDGFGFVNTMKLLGVERRLLTAGKNKAFLDQFSPLKADEQNHARALLQDIHQQFIDVVKEGRGSRLKGEDGELFNGLIWTGTQSIENGLTDAIGSVDYVAREIIKEDNIIDFTQNEDLLQRLTQRVGTSISGMLKSILLESSSVSLR